MAEEGKCIICGKEAEVGSLQRLVGIYNKCSHCNVIIHFENHAVNVLNGHNGARFRACLYYYFTHFRYNNEKPYLIIKDGVEREDYNVVTVEQIMNLYPKNITERIDKILLNLVGISSYIGAEIPIKKEPEKYMQILFIDNIDSAQAERKTLLDIMANQELIIEATDTERGNNCIIDYKGWQRIDELNKKLNTRKQGFVAMWFPEDHCMDECRSAIEEVFDETGYKISIIDEKQHNNQIVPEILYEIQMSDFVVADLTGNRNGVYYEAGYALGMGKPVILMTDKRRIDKDKSNAPHFDVAQVNQIRYEDYEDLKIQLYNRISSTIGNLKNSSAELKKRNG